VVELSSAAGVQDTTSVVVELIALGIDSKGSWGLHQSSLQSRLASRFDVSDGSDSNSSVTACVLTSSIFGSVWILGLVADSVVLSIGNGISLHSTIAAVPLGLAVNDLLLSKVNNLSSLEVVSSFDNSSSREGPARSALSLVFDWSKSDSSPVNRGINFDVLLIELLLDVLNVAWEADLSLEVLLLLISHVREHVVANSEGSVLAVELLDELVSSLEVIKSEHEFLFGGVGFSVSDNVFVESLLNFFNSVDLS